MEAVDNGEVVGALLIDMSKAFDMVPHQMLLAELSDIGCSTNALRWLHNYLCDREQRVVQNSTTTPWRQISRGVP